MSDGHKPEPDGYCPTCRMVPCRERGKPGGTSTTGQQLSRIEAKLNKILRAMKLEAE